MKNKCRCGCSERLHNPKRRFLPGHNLDGSSYGKRRRPTRREERYEATLTPVPNNPQRTTIYVRPRKAPPNSPMIYYNSDGTKKLIKQRTT